MKLKGLIVAGLALAIVGCSTAQTSVLNFLKNVSAADCATPASQQAALANLPTPFLTSSQAQMLLATFCVGQFGTVAAPVSATGMSPAIK